MVDTWLRPLHWWLYPDDEMLPLPPELQFFIQVVTELTKNHILWEDVAPFLVYIWENDMALAGHDAKSITSPANTQEIDDCDTECVICTNTFSRKDSARKTTCEHILGGWCPELWMRETGSPYHCPVCRASLVNDRLMLPEPLRPAYDRFAALLKQMEAIDWKINHCLMTSFSETPSRAFVDFLFELDELGTDSAAALDDLIEQAMALRPLSTRAVEALGRWIEKVRTLFRTKRPSHEEWRTEQFRFLNGGGLAHDL
ncbi:hypothetical protein K491DRAFT_721951 [Lophiostoma macrostomum CBS 122681]|uniref:RING-type domain-containing protein n=1 Tax=Lophiostoma macrostomum CBS 122681 TaxID=1314788 RepID=A0A6A6SRZ3_9PLEO|nr:hypothetical protein K491DRAFT_721951 [Lophiostoma macrostomum CBS 122681]